ncbi:MAG: nucleotide exchange factor GrpE [Candidatus Obscuribacterales bacterium]|nr:nucleotide exchange factor GrpE [Candidatus Obscuribacterales bacterium]
MPSEQNPILKLVTKVTERLGLKSSRTPLKPDKQAQGAAHPLINTIQQSAEQLRQELDTYKNEINAIEQEFERTQSQTKDLIKDSVESTLKELFSQVSPSCVMLVTQKHLHTQGKETTPEQVFTVTQELLQVLIDNGLNVFGTPGEVVPYNPNKHSLPSAEAELSENDAVKILAPGTEFQGYVLQRAQVELKK